MGADIIGWIDCPLQHELSINGFLGKLKLRAYRGAVEANVPEGQRDGIRVQVMTDGREPREISYPQILAELGEFEAGIPECASCPISEGRPLGCYQYVTYPIDATFENLLFDFYVSQVETKDSICNQIYADIISQIPGSGTAWHLRRGNEPGASLAVAAQPREHKWGGFLSKKRVDSAQMLMASFITLESLPLVAAYTRYFTELMEFANARGVQPQESQTLAEVSRLGTLLMTLLPGAIEGKGMLFVDG